MITGIILFSELQKDGRYSVCEQFTDDLGNTWQQYYIADSTTNQNTHLINDLALLNGAN